jgi:uncharacterized membrane protein YebE (DUF533 family)
MICRCLLWFAVCNVCNPELSEQDCKVETVSNMASSSKSSNTPSIGQIGAILGGLAVATGAGYLAHQAIKKNKAKQTASVATTPSSTTPSTSTPESKKPNPFADGMLRQSIMDHKNLLLWLVN